jgi:hypothetical protein
VTPGRAWSLRRLAAVALNCADGAATAPTPVTLRQELSVDGPGELSRRPTLNFLSEKKYFGSGWRAK